MKELEFIGHKIEIIQSNGAFWSIVYINRNLRLWSKAEKTYEMAIANGKLIVLTWQLEQDKNPTGITLLNYELPIIYKNKALIKLFDELKLDSHHLCQQEINYREATAPLSCPLKWAGKLETLRGKIIEIPELKWKVFKWRIHLGNHVHSLEGESVPAPGSYKYKLYLEQDNDFRPKKQLRIDEESASSTTQV